MTVFYNLLRNEIALKSGIIAGIVLIFSLLISGCKNNSINNDTPETLPVVIINGELKEIQKLSFKPMQIGVAYYPERRTEVEWQNDFEKMKQAGIKRIRIAEFAWSRIEKNEGIFDWTLLDKSIKLAGAYGLEVMICTPTAAPPIWLVKKFPNILPVNENGEQIRFGGRQHRCYNNKNYLAYSLKISTALAERFGNNPTVVAWQIDNEFGGEVKRCYCTNCKNEFQRFLESEYSTIEELNRRWGNAFWSMDYQYFKQIDPPFLFKGELTVKNHPSLELEYSRFASNSIVNFSNQMVEAIRKYSVNQLITTNRFAYEWGDNLNSFDLNKNMDASGFDLYTDHLHQIAFYADVNRSLLTENSWVLEYGVTSGNLKNEMELLQSRGVEWLYFFKLNPFPSGAEQSNESLLTITGEPTENYAIIKEWTSQIDLNKKFNTIPSGVGLYFDFESSWMHFFPTWGNYQERLIYQNYLINTVYKSLFEKELISKIVFQPSDINNLHTLILPLQIRFSDELENKLMEFIKLGGRVFITNDFFQKNRDNVYLTVLPKFYTDVLQVKNNSFFRNSSQNQIVLKQNKYGKGEAFVINKSASVDDWKTIIDQYVLYQPLTIN